MSNTENAGPVKAIGIQTLCNLYLEGKLDGAELDFLKEVVKDFQTDRFLTHHLVDLVQGRLIGSERIGTGDELAEILKNVILDKPGQQDHGRRR